MRGKYGRSESSHVSEYRSDVVIRREEIARLEAAPAALHANERIARGERAAAVRRVRLRLDLEERVEPAAQVFRPAHTDARRIGAHPVDVLLGAWRRRTRRAG